MRKIVIALIIVTLIQIANATTLHVDDDNKDYPNAEYNDIQQAINAAKDGDVILIYKGAYKPFVVDKKLNITGIEFPEVIASKENSKIEVKADGVILEGLVTNATIMLNSSNNLVLENGIVGNTGILATGENNRIAGNVFVGNKYGILLRSNKNTVLSNRILGCNFGISGKVIDNNVIAKNEFLDSNVSIVLYKSEKNLVSENVLRSKVLGLNLLECSNNLIQKNRFFNSTGWAVRIAGGGRNIIADNIFENNTVTKVNGVAAGFNMFVMNSTSDIIAGNVVKGVVQEIVGVFAFNTSDLAIVGNTIASNIYGVYLWKCNNAAIEENYIAFNGNGTKIDESSGITIYNSTFQNNDWATVAKSSGLNITKNFYVLNLHTINLKSSNNAKIVQNAIVKNKYGIVLENSDSCLIKNNSIAKIEDYAVSLIKSNRNSIYNNTMKENKGGIKIDGSENEITRNVVSLKNGFGDYVLYITKPRNTIYFNDFMSDSVYSTGGNLFNSPTKLNYEYMGKTFTNYLGNFWNDVTESMLKMLDPDNDGIIMKQKLIGIEKDKYPLAKSIKNYKILS